MNNNKHLKDIFSIFHDGIICDWIGDKNLLRFTIECEYLASKINPTFEKFYIKLIQIEILELELWTSSEELSSKILTSFSEIFNTELEILSAENKEDFTVVLVNQVNSKNNYTGGELFLKSYEIKIFDHLNRELSIDQLKELSKNYWR
jgi:hypothetical protein